MKGIRSMEDYVRALDQLRRAATGGQDYLERSSPEFAFDYVTEIVCPLQRQALALLRRHIDDLHKLDEAEPTQDFVVHYTSIARFVSMLKDAAREMNQERKKLDTDSKVETKKSLWRLYDSVHLNDPDEGNFFTRNLSLPKKYFWLTNGRFGHAYIASFVLPRSGSELDAENNLVFWQTYGREGEGCSIAMPLRRSLLQRVRYGTDEMKPIVRILAPALKSLAESMDPLVNIRNRQLQAEVREELAGVVWQNLEKYRYLYKDEAYAHESECRLVVPESDIENKDEIYFEPKDLNCPPLLIRHYCEHQELRIRELLATGSSITLGPRVSNPENVCYFINELRRRAYLLPLRIKISRIPYQKF